MISRKERRKEGRKEHKKEVRNKGRFQYKAFKQ
jgi:hypothetical protein